MSGIWKGIMRRSALRLKCQEVRAFSRRVCAPFVRPRCASLLMGTSSASSREPAISFIVQYFQHPRQLHELCRRLQHPNIEVIIHADSSTSADVAALHGV